MLQLLLTSRRAFGDVVRFRLGPLIVHLVSHPDHIKHVLVTNQQNYDKGTRSSAKIQAVTGPGLLTSNGDFWLRQRRLVQPAFQPQHVGGFLDIMTAATAAMLKRWQSYADQGRPLNVASEMMRLTYTIVGRALFGADLTSDLDAVEQAATIVMEHTWHRLETVLDLPPSWPTPRNLRFRQALATLDRIVNRIIRDRQHANRPNTDLLYLLLGKHEEGSGEGMSARQLRHETVTLLLAGHETTANSLTWTWYLLSRYADVARRVRAEIDAVLGQRIPTLADLANLKYLTMVFRESLRLYPPIWIMERRVLAEDTIAGYRMPCGSSIVLCPYVTHRHPDFWDNPERFDPERFTPERSAGHSPYAYIPFGSGPRHCIGHSFALLEAQVILAMVLQAYRLDLVPGFPVEPKPGITLRTRRGLLMTLHPPGKE